MSKIDLENITLVAMTSVNISETIKAITYSCKDINFGSVKLITHEIPNNLPSFIEYNYIDKIDNIDDWNYKIIFHLHEYIQTEFAILIHDDGFIVNADSWRDDFLNYDYIGAPWSHNHLLDRDGKQIKVGNSVSIRSHKLLKIPSEKNMPWIKYDNNYNEDTQICVWNRNLFLDNGIKFADFDIAKYFSHEEYFKEYDGIKPFCFHNFGGLKNGEYKKIVEL